MNVVILNCFDTYENRVDLIYRYFKGENHNVKIIQSDFKHIKKIKRIDEKEDCIFIKTEKYKKNLSYKRMKSHYRYSKNAIKSLEKMDVDLIYVILPPNSLAKYAVEYKLENPKCKLIFDIMDLWPETMPFNFNKKMQPFKFWASMRNNAFKHADFIISECDLYREVLNKELNGVKCKTILLARDIKKIKLENKLSQKFVEICYVGSINNIIDIESIKKVLTEINEVRTVRLHIIGAGENKERFINEMKKIKIDVKFYGAIYDINKKIDIFNKCHFGLNLMKDNVCVGLTMKSIDYFEAGLPLLNNIKSDTSILVDKNNLGINIDSNDKSFLKEKIMEINFDDISNFYQKKKNVRQFFEDDFSYKKFAEKLDSVIKSID